MGGAFGRDYKIGGYSPDIIALCEDGTLWLADLSEFGRWGLNDTTWKQLSREFKGD